MRYAILLAALLASGCATRGGFEKVMNSHLGDSEGQLVGRYGPPLNVYVAPDGSRVLTYTRSSNMQLGGGTTYQPVTSTTNGNIYGAGGSANYQSTTTSYQPVQQPTYNVALSCTVNFRLVNDHVQSWQANGNHCVA